MLNGTQLVDKRECEIMEEEAYAKTCTDCSCYIQKTCVAGKLSE